jgi:hypothetical protein
VAKSLEPDERLDELYRGEPKEFVAGRNGLAKELRAAGDREAAERVGKLRRPSAAAWMLNRVALESPEELHEFAAATAALEREQARAVEGDEGAAAGWREAAAREREATEAVVARAERLATDAGQAPNARTLDLVASTLRAGAGDAELRDAILRGRLERERSAATLATLATGATPKPSARSRKRRERREASRELERLEGQVAEAEARRDRLGERVEQVGEALRQEKARLAEAKRETAKRKRELAAAKRRSKG